MKAPPTRFVEPTWVEKYVLDEITDDESEIICVLLYLLASITTDKSKDLFYDGTELGLWISNGKTLQTACDGKGIAFPIIVYNSQRCATWKMNYL